MKQIAIFASGSGSNAENIIKYFSVNQAIRVSLVLSNRTNSGVLKRAKKHNIPSFTFTSNEFYNGNKVIKLLKYYKVSMIILAGFLLKIPSSMIKMYPNSIINLHPSLLPKYGGKGMFGSNVHLAVLKNKENKSGITIHYVNEHYDQGTIIFQATCEVFANDSLISLENRIKDLEQKNFPKVIETLF